MRYQCPRCGEVDVVLVYRCDLNGDGDPQRLAGTMAGEELDSQDAECVECDYGSSVDAFDTTKDDE